MHVFLKVKAIIIALTLAVTGARAEVMEVWSHNLDGGDYARNVKQYERLRPIVENLGAYVEYYMEDMDGAAISHFVVKFDNMRSWGAYRDRLSMHPSFLKWNKRHRARANQLQVDTSLMNNIYEPSAKADLYRGADTFYITQWKAMPGKTAAMRAAMIEGAKIAENNGIFAQAYANGYSDMFMAVWAFDSYTGAATQLEYLENSREFQSFFKRTADQKIGIFIDQSWMVKTQPYEGE
jgi:hypothetical protein